MSKRKKLSKRDAILLRKLLTKASKKDIKAAAPKKKRGPKDPSAGFARQINAAMDYEAFVATNIEQGIRKPKLNAKIALFQQRTDLNRQPSAHELKAQDKYLQIGRRHLNALIAAVAEADALDEQAQ